MNYYKTNTITVAVDFSTTVRPNVPPKLNSYSCIYDKDLIEVTLRTPYLWKEGNSISKKDFQNFEK